MENNEEFITNPKIADKIERRALLPWWMKIFCWIFMLVGLENSLNWLLRLSVDQPLYVNLFSNRLDVTILLLSPLGFLIGTLVLFKAFVGYALWFEKDNALKLGKIDVVLSTVASLIMVGIGLYENDISYYWLEVLLLIPYYLSLNSLEEKWKRTD